MRSAKQWADKQINSGFVRRTHSNDKNFIIRARTKERGFPEEPLSFTAFIYLSSAKVKSERWIYT
jgi:hypothetical protein